MTARGNDKAKNASKLLGIILLYAALTLPFLTTFPPVDNVGDESWMMNISVELLRSGRPVASIFRDTPVGETAQISTLWIYSGVLTGFFSLLGPQVWAGRFLSFLCGVLVLVLTYLFGKQLGGSKVGLAACFLLSTSLAFSWHSREMRPDMMLLAFTTLSLYLFHRAWAEKRDGLLFLSALVASIGVEVHPHSAIFSLSMLFMYAIYFRKRILSRSTLLLVAGFSAGLVLWVLCNYLPYSASSFETVHGKYLPPVLKENVLHLAGKGLLDLLWIFSNLKLLEVKYHSHTGTATAYLCLFVVVPAFTFGRNKHILFLLSFAALSLFLRTFMTGSWNWFHFSAFLSVCFLVVSVAIFDIADRLSGKARTLFSTIMIAALAAPGTWDIMRNTVDMMKYDHGTVMEKVARGVPPQGNVLGPPFYYPAFVDRENSFVSYLFLEGKCPDFAAEMKSLAIDYILMDTNFRVRASRWCSEEYYRKQVLGFLDSSATLVNVIEINYPNEYAYDRLISSAYLFRVNH